MKISRNQFLIIAFAILLIFVVFRLITAKSRHITPLNDGKMVVNQVSLTTDFAGAKIKPEDLDQGCFTGQDCIPSIDKPIFESASEASWLNDKDIVFAINIESNTKAYPQRILNWHEIVNDTISTQEVRSLPIAVTFCPLCGSALGFIREVNAKYTEFGVSGKLHNSDLVMYDRLEGNLWQQITGVAIAGPAARRNEKLKQIPIVTTTWSEWKKEHPDTLVLSRDTGHSRDYDAYPYGTYEQNDQLYFGVKNLDKKLQIKTVVYGIEIAGKSKAYPENALKTGEKITDQLGGVNLSVEKLPSGEIKFISLDSGEEIIPVRLFWFAWAAFHPDTLIYKK